MSSGQPGGASGAANPPPSSASNLVTVLVPVFVYAAVYFAIFLALRPIFKRQYSPRTFLGSLKPENRTPSLPDSKFGWFGSFFSLPDTYILNHHTLDGFLFLRFLKMAIIMLLVGCVITMPVLFPVNATGGGGLTQLDLLTFGNVQNGFRYFAHAGCAILFLGFILYMITRESIYYINLRQAYLLSPFYTQRLSSRTVLFNSVPEDYMDPVKLRGMFKGVRNVWLAQDVKELEDKVKERDDAAMKLEGAETKLIKTANGARLKAEKKGANTENHDAAVEEGSGIAARYLKPKDRPTHRTKFLIGKKVDTIDWCRGELKKLIPEVDEMQAKARAHENKNLNSVFIEFDTIGQAQSAYQSVAHHQALHMSPRLAGVHPNEVIWGNLRIKWWERIIRSILTTAFIVALIIFWAIPVAGVGAISNVPQLINTFPWLGFINNLPKVLLGLITGLLPTIAFAILLALVPPILRFASRLGGAPTRSATEYALQNSYFAFYLVQGFAVITIGSSASSAGGQIASDPSSAPSLLAKKIPLSANFYLAYFVLQGLGIVSSLLLNVAGLVVFKLLGKFLDSTPRKMFNRWANLTALTWGSVIPVYTTFACIGIIYSIIQPLVLIFCAIGLALFYFAYRYNLMYVSNVEIDMKGRLYTRALQQLMVGVYVAEVCYIGLFAIKTGSGDLSGEGAIGPLILMIIMLVFTILYHVSLNSALEPLINYLPTSLEYAESQLQLAETGEVSPTIQKGAGDGTNGTNGVNSKEAVLDGPAPAPHKKPNMLAKFLKPHIYNDYETMRRLVPSMIPIEYAPETVENAFFNPAITTKTPLLWIPRDSMGISKEEIANTQAVIPITDEAAYLDEKNNIVWDAEDGRPPIYEEKPYY